MGRPEKPLNVWRYQLEASGEGTDVTESFTLAKTLPLRLYWAVLGWARGKTNRDGMRTTLERIKAEVEAGQFQFCRSIDVFQLLRLGDSQEGRLGGCEDRTVSGVSVLIWMYSGSPADGWAVEPARRGCSLGQWLMVPGTVKPEDSTQSVRQEMLGANQFKPSSFSSSRR